MKMSKLSNQTNSQDPQAVNSRVFVGNLNTFQCSKTDVERMFQRYGRLAGISMHKGYAFVQFTNPFDARNACLGEDGRNILSQTLDVNMVAEPKEHQVGRKRQNINKTGNDWEYYYDSYYTSTIFPSSGPRPMKRPRLQQQQVLPPPPPSRLINGMPNQQLNGHHQQQQSLSPLHNGHHHHTSGPHGHINGTSAAAGHIGDDGQNPYLMTNFFQNGSGGASSLNGHQQHHPALPPLSSLQSSLSFKVYSNPDVLICGNCRECFSEITELLEHKKTYCKLRFACKCQHSNGNTLGVGRNCSTAVPTASAEMAETTPPASTATETVAEASSSVSTKINPPSTLTTAAEGGTAPLSAARLLCVVCKSVYQSPWDLMVHVQAAHMINIYEVSAEKPVLCIDSGITERNSSPEVPSPTVRSPNGERYTSKSKEDQHDTGFLVVIPPENLFSATTVSSELKQRGEGHPDNHSGGGNKNNALSATLANNNRTPPTLNEELVMPSPLYDLENASSSSPISQIEIEAGDSGNKLSNDNALLTFACPTVTSTPNVAVLGALSIVSSL